MTATGMTGADIYAAIHTRYQGIRMGVEGSYWCPYPDDENYTLQVVVGHNTSGVADWQANHRNRIVDQGKAHDVKIGWLHACQAVAGDIAAQRAAAELVADGWAV